MAKSSLDFPDHDLVGKLNNVVISGVRDSAPVGDRGSTARPGEGEQCR